MDLAQDWDTAPWEAISPAQLITPGAGCRAAPPRVSLAPFCMGDKGLPAPAGIYSHVGMGLRI